MFETGQKEIAIKIGKFIAPKLDNYESILFLLFVISLVLKIFTDFPVDIFINLILISLSILYFFSAFSDVQDEYTGGLDIFIYKLVCWGCSVGIIGILFRLENWPGYNFTTTVGCIILLISLVVILIINNKKPELKIFTSRWILRIFVIIVIGLSLKFISNNNLIKIGLYKVNETTISK